jgi:SAM-dependent methyltransferase
MKAFIDGAPRACEAGALYSVWNAADVRPQRDAFARAGYAACQSLNLDDGPSLAAFVDAPHNRYDVIIALHVLEHLSEPERAVRFLAHALKPNGRLLGGFPVVPRGLDQFREKQIRKTAQPHGHVSAFSPQRVHRMAHQAGMVTDYASGAFAVRASGSFLEDREWWMRANIAFGAIFPSWPGEIYFQLRKPA